MATSHLVLAKPDDLGQLQRSASPSTGFDGAEVAGLLRRHVASLHEILVREGDEDLYEPIGQGSGGAAIVRIPDELIAALAVVEGKRQQLYATSWKNHDGPTEYLGTLCALARRAKQSRRALFLWISP
jgi:hypothetical protein